MNAEPKQNSEPTEFQKTNQIIHKPFREDNPWKTFVEPPKPLILVS